MACTCTTCGACKGSGIVWFAANGTYLGNFRSDDMDEFESCDYCGGEGVEDYCDECMEAIEREQEEEYERKENACPHCFKPL